MLFSAWGANFRARHTPVPSATRVVASGNANRQNALMSTASSTSVERPSVTTESGPTPGGTPTAEARLPATPASPPRRLPATTDSSREAMLVRHQRLREEGHCIEQISGAGCEIEPALLAGSIEGFVGFARVPLGVAGPVHIEGSAAQGDFFIPLATSEGTLVASFQHAFNAINRCGGARALCSREQVARAPASNSPISRRPAGSPNGCRRCWIVCAKPSPAPRATAAWSPRTRRSSVTRSIRSSISRLATPPARTW